MRQEALPGQAPDFAEPLLGFRAWDLSKEGYLLSTFDGKSWAPGVNHATCAPMIGTRVQHRAPYPGCGCGFNAFHSLGDHQLGQIGSFVIGAIAAWGDIDVYKTGFRAEFACVVALSYNGATTIDRYRALQRAAERHEVRLLERHDLVAEALRYGAPLPKEQLPRPGTPPQPKRSPSRSRPTSPPSRKRPGNRTSPAPAKPALQGAPSTASVPGPAPMRLRPRPKGPPWKVGEIGYRLASHTGIAVAGDVASVSLTPAFLAVVGTPTRLRFTAPKSQVLPDEVVAVLETDAGRFAVAAPFAGAVTEVNAALAQARPLRLTPGDWLVKVKTRDAEIAASTVVWGDEGWNSYRRYVSPREDSAIRRELALSEAPAPSGPGAPPDLSSAESLRALAEALDSQLAADEALQAALAEREIELAFWAPALGAGIVVRMERPDRPAISYCETENDAALALTLEPRALHEYWAGLLDVPAALGGGVALRGSRQDLLRATALLRRLFPPHAERLAAIREAGRSGVRAVLSAGAAERARRAA